MLLGGSERTSVGALHAYGIVVSSICGVEVAEQARPGVREHAHLLDRALVRVVRGRFEVAGVVHGLSDALSARVGRVEGVPCVEFFGVGAGEEAVYVCDVRCHVVVGVLGVGER